ncbi:2-oxoglutarate and iron-dependent oxygenase domain-containing protein 3-like [Amphibalanus amphitrite]|uniref:2-oxoglutarate and iron-dependent oxygenase domain-containing protein 3-like n=1 Tax=Amphibalanus amphitrite TaxID=1232801 RepID=UPI001C90634E|nr:2-oxoglutarate and iron-dependent oxygenase domain-containing protein 3-like [Amphibalanus amphitrite]
MTGSLKKRHQGQRKQQTSSAQPDSSHNGPVKESNGNSRGGDHSSGDASGPGKRRLSEATIQRLLLRLAVLLAAAGVYFYTRQDKILELATAKDNIGKRSQPVACSDKYTAEIANYPGCTPSRCGRVISDKVVTPHEAQALRDIATRAFQLTGGSSGGASILDLHSGALSKGSSFVNVYQLPESQHLVSESDLRIYKAVKQRVAHFISEHFQLAPGVLKLAKPTFFSRMTTKEARTVHDEYWHTHVDKETYPSFHYTSLVYLNDYGHDFQGGRFIFNDNDANRTVEPKTGRVSAFTAGWENPHQVEPVSDGVRFALTVAFTCDQSQAISDPERRTGPM